MNDSSRPILQARNLSRHFGDLKAVSGLDLEVYEGEIFGLVGPDGSGKTTTLRLMCGLMDTSSGEVMIDGLDVASHPGPVRDRIGYMAQRFGLYDDLTVDENLGFYADLFGISQAESEPLTGHLLEMTRMEPFRQRRAAQLSGGMKQKLALMCTLLHRPRLLLLDEPTSGVDPVSRRDFWAILYRLVREGMTVLVATAYLDEAERCSRVGLMYRGRLVRCDAPDRLIAGFAGKGLAIATQSLRKARGRLAGEPGVLSVELSGPALHLFLDPALTSREQLAGRLREEGIEDARFRPLTPSLEDVYLRFVREQKEEVA